MNADDTLLLAYVDGDLSPERSAEVEAIAASSAEVAARLAALRASALPYGAAFERQALPPVPPELIGRVAKLLGASGARPSAARRERYWPRLAAAFFAGALIGGAMLNLWSSGALRAFATASASPWVQAVAEYQALYSRETIVNVVADPTLTAKTVGELRGRDALPVSIPDLGDAGLTFKRVQRLTYRDRPVAQLVYLPQDGDPVALCLTREAGGDEAPHAQQVEGMQTVTWRRDRVGYVLLGRPGQIDLSLIAKRIVRGESRALYTRADLAPWAHDG